MCHCHWLEGVGARLFLLFYKQEWSRALTDVLFPYCSGPVVERFSRCEGTWSSASSLRGPTRLIGLSLPES
jgi:hypothetical protein